MYGEEHLAIVAPVPNGLKLVIHSFRADQLNKS